MLARFCLLIPSRSPLGLGDHEVRVNPSTYKEAEAPARRS